MTDLDSATLFTQMSNKWEKSFFFEHDKFNVCHEM